MPKISEAHYEQGLAAYRSGHSIRQVLELSEAVGEAVAKGADALPPEQRGDSYRLAHEAEHSIALGFADGVLSDMRMVLTSPTFQRSGQRA